MRPVARGLPCGEIPDAASPPLGCTFPDEPLWSGIDDIADDGNGVVVRFHDGEDPALRRAGGADVACVLYGEDSQG